MRVSLRFRHVFCDFRATVFNVNARRGKAAKKATKKGKG
jgi:hypothetical protein